MTRSIKNAAIEPSKKGMWLAFLRTSLLALILLAHGCGGGGTGIEPIPVSDSLPPVIISFVGTSNTIDVGDTITLSWDVNQATTLEILPNIGLVTGTSSITISVSESTNFILLATNSYGQVQASFQVNVLEPDEVLLTVSNHANSLMAVATLSLSSPGRVYIEYFSENEDTKQTARSESALEHNLTVAGLRENTTYQLKAIVEFDSGEVLQLSSVDFTSGVIPIAAPSIMLNVASEESLGGITFFGALDAYWGVDEVGQIVWYYQTGEVAGTAVIRVLEHGEFAGNLLIFLRNELRVINAAGETLASYDMSSVGGYHHDARIMNNGHVLTIARETRSPNGIELLGDVVIELDSNGDIVWQWSTFDHLDAARYPGGEMNNDDGAFDWSHCNAVVYLEEEDAILLSCRGQNWVIKIDHQSGDVIWILGENSEISPGFEPSFFTLEDGTWFTGQHAPVLSDDGKLMVFDNRNQSGGQSNNSRAVSYNLDQINLTASQEWEYISPKFSHALGDVDPLDNGHVLVVSGGESGAGGVIDNNARIIEINSDVSPSAVWDISVEDLEVYRAERVSWQDFLAPVTALSPCDLKLSNGQIYTFDDDDAVVSTLAILDNKIRAVGETADSMTSCTNVIDLQGRVVIPGLNDAHVHYFDRINAGGNVVAEIDTARSQQEVLDRLTAAIDIQNVAAISGNVTVRNFLVTEGGNYAAQLSEGSWPNLSQLNQVPRPVFLVEGPDNGGWVNQSAKDFFDAAGVGNVQSDGEVLDVVGAKNYLLSLETNADKQQDWLDGNRWAASVGMTALQNFQGEPLSNNPEIVELYEQGIAFLRFHFSVSNTVDFLSTPESTTLDMLRLTSIGEFHSGSSFAAPGINYADDALEMAASGITTQQHAMTSNSDIEAYINLWEAAAEIDPGIHNLRWRLDHVFDISTSQLNRLAQIGGNVSVHGIAGSGAANAAAQNLRQTIDNGINVSAGSDGGNFYAINPWVSIHYFVTGKGQTGNQVMFAEYAVSLYEAIGMYTIGSAFDTFDEAKIGSLEVGKLADLAVLAEDPFDLESAGRIDELINMRSVLTLVDGKIVYSKGLIACNGSMDDWYRNLSSPQCEL